jgi:hypothetical protein
MEKKDIEKLSFIEIEQIIKERNLSRIVNIIFSLTTIFLMFLKFISGDFKTFDLTIITMLYFSFMFPVLMNEYTNNKIKKRFKKYYG